MPNPTTQTKDQELDMRPSAQLQRLTSAVAEFLHDSNWVWVNQDGNVPQSVHIRTRAARERHCGVKVFRKLQRDLERECPNWRELIAGREYLS